MKWPMEEAPFVQWLQHPGRRYHLSVFRATGRTGQLMVTSRCHIYESNQAADALDAINDLASDVRMDHPALTLVKLKFLCRYRTFVSEDAGPNTLVATVLAKDPDGDGIIYSITAGNEEENFIIDSQKGNRLGLAWLYVLVPNVPIAKQCFICLFYLYCLFY